MAHLNVFGCLTDSGSVVRSGTVENDFLILWYRRELGLKFTQGNGPLQMHSLESLMAVVGAHQESVSGCHFPISLVWIDTFRS